MAWQLIYTSAPQGLKAGSGGYCTVACSAGMPPNLVALLESLSGYKPHFPPYDPDAQLNPVCRFHYRRDLNAQQLSLLGEIRFAGFDHTRRSNKLAQHLVLTRRERESLDPAALLTLPELFPPSWEGEPRLLPPARPPVAPPPAAAKAAAWEALGGDAGWAGSLARAFLDSPAKPAFIVFRPGQDVVPLLAEALALLPPERRWDVTYNSYTENVPPGLDCAWRCCLEDSPALALARQTPGVWLVDLDKRRQSEHARRLFDNACPLVQAARTGLPPPPPASRPLTIDIPEFRHEPATPSAPPAPKPAEDDGVDFRFSWRRKTLVAVAALSATVLAVLLLLRPSSPPPPPAPVQDLAAKTPSSAMPDGLKPAAPAVAKPEDSPRWVDSFAYRYQRGLASGNVFSLPMPGLNKDATLLVVGAGGHERQLAPGKAALLAEQTVGIGINATTKAVELAVFEISPDGAFNVRVNKRDRLYAPLKPEEITAFVIDGVELPAKFVPDHHKLDNGVGSLTRVNQQLLLEYQFSAAEALAFGSRATFLLQSQGDKRRVVPEKNRVSLSLNLYLDDFCPFKDLLAEPLAKASARAAALTAGIQADAAALKLHHSLQDPAALRRELEQRLAASAKGSVENRALRGVVAELDTQQRLRQLLADPAALAAELGLKAALDDALAGFLDDLRLGVWIEGKLVKEIRFAEPTTTPRPGGAPPVSLPPPPRGAP